MQPKSARDPPPPTLHTLASHPRKGATHVTHASMRPKLARHPRYHE